jgi:hypothetical protein
MRLSPLKLISRLSLWPHDSCNRLIDASCLFCRLKRLVALITSSPSNFSMWGVFCGLKITLSLPAWLPSFSPPPAPSRPPYLPPSADTCRPEATVRCILQESTSARVQIPHKRARFQLWVPDTPYTCVLVLLYGHHISLEETTNMLCVPSHAVLSMRCDLFAKQALNMKKLLINNELLLY